MARAVAPPPSRSSPASATPATRRWPMWWRLVRASRRPSAGTHRAGGPALVGRPGRRAGGASWPAGYPLFSADAQSGRSGSRPLDRGGPPPAPRRTATGWPTGPALTRLRARRLGRCEAGTCPGGPFGPAPGPLGRRTNGCTPAPPADAYDVERQLERGYSLTLTTDGSLGAGRGFRGGRKGDRHPLRRRNRASRCRVHGERPRPRESWETREGTRHEC